MKTIGRVLAILLVAGALAAGIYLIVQYHPAALGLSSARTDFAKNTGGEFESFNRGNADFGQFSGASGGTGFRERHHDFGGGTSFGRGLMGIVRILVVFGLITLMVLAVQKGVSFARRKIAARSG